MPHPAANALASRAGSGAGSALGMLPEPVQDGALGGGVAASEANSDPVEAKREHPLKWTEWYSSC